MPRENPSDRPVVDHVAIALSADLRDGVKIGRRFGHVQHGDVVGQIGVQRTAERLGRKRRIGAQSDDLLQGVNAGVGPPAGQDADSLAGDLGNGVFERFLDGNPIGLELPAGVVRAVVGDGEFESSHGPAAIMKCWIAPCENRTKSRAACYFTLA